jgi:hypothetical protein
MGENHNSDRMGYSLSLDVPYRCIDIWQWVTILPNHLVDDL